jgi:hypothetical protein
LRKKPAHKGYGPKELVARGCGAYPARHFVNRIIAKRFPTGFV